MRRHLFSVSLAAVGLFLLASDASACHKKRACVCPPTPCATTVVVQPQPVEACVVQPSKHGHRLAGLRGRIGGLHKARRVHSPAPCATTVQQSVVYSSVVYSAPAPVDCGTQACPTPQAPAVPTKTVPVPPSKTAPVPPAKATPQGQN